MGDVCPIPVVKAKKAIKELGGSGEVEVLVDNPIAVENLTKLAKNLGCTAAAEKKGEAEYSVKIAVGEGAAEPTDGGESCYMPAGKSVSWWRWLPGRWERATMNSARCSQRDLFLL